MSLHPDSLATTLPSDGGRCDVPYLAREGANSAPAARPGGIDGERLGVWVLLPLALLVSVLLASSVLAQTAGRGVATLRITVNVVPAIGNSAAARRYQPALVSEVATPGARLSLAWPNDRAPLTLIEQLRKLSESSWQELTEFSARGTPTCASDLTPERIALALDANQGNDKFVLTRTVVPE